MNKKAITILIHVICWALFLFLPVVFSPNFGTRPKEINHIFGYPLRFILNNLFLVAFFYFNAYFLVPRFFFFKKNLLYFGSILLLLVLFLVISEIERAYFLRHYNLPPPFPSGAVDGQRIYMPKAERTIYRLQGATQDIHFLPCLVARHHIAGNGPVTHNRKTI